MAVIAAAACSSPTPSGGGIDASIDVSCAAGETACEGRCVSLEADRNHCGACGNACPGAQVCAEGRCALGCPATQTACGERCVDLMSDRASCGACGNACGQGEVCAEGRCGLECGPSLARCGGGDGGAGAPFCADTRVDRANCGACGNACAAGEICESGRCVLQCPTGSSACGGRCVDLQGDRANCGACGTTCAEGEVCALGRCGAAGVTCPTGSTSCSGVCRDLTSDRAHCGACGTACGAGELCQAGVCELACGGGTTRCGTRCVDLQTDARSCGACDTACAEGQRCVAGVCSAAGCPSNLTLCGGECVDTRYDPDHCGACGRACTPFPNLTRACGGGACVPGVCVAGYADCNGMTVDGCEVSTGSDPNNCGGCGRACTALPNASAMCAAGACTIGACNADYADCDGAAMNGCEAALQTDRMNCGACGNACDPGRVCVSGVCTTQPLYHGWTSPLAGCDTSSYNATATTNLGGRYPYNTGDSLACRAWKLAATICTTEPTAYSGTSNWYCPMSGGFTDPVFGTYCPRASQYACSTCPGACNAGCAYNPLSLRNCSGSEQAQP
ncbi:MAG: MXAN_6577-like cysteine-rich protein [Polyangiales bacterium]